VGGVSTRYVEQARKPKTENAAASEQARRGEKTLTEIARKQKEKQREQKRAENRDLVTKAAAPETFGTKNVR